MRREPKRARPERAVGSRTSGGGYTRRHKKQRLIAVSPFSEVHSFRSGPIGLANAVQAVQCAHKHLPVRDRRRGIAFVAKRVLA